MCACEEDIGRAVLPHQLDRGTVYQTRDEVPVTLGFQPGICNGCRGIPEDATPMASIPGRTSKISRYYWRELFFETERMVISELKTFPDADPVELRKRAEKTVLEDLKKQHQTQPKYQYTERSQAEVIKAYDVQIDRVDAKYLPQGSKGHQIDDGKGGCSPETYAADHYRSQGYQVFELESAPFHALFGTFMWALIQDPTDHKNQYVSFGSRTDFDAGTSGNLISMFLPPDFGSPAYAERRAAPIEEHMRLLLPGRRSLFELFDDWEWHSQDFRQYLWAHRPDSIRAARTLVEHLPPAAIIRILRYLIADYWGRFCGWPDLLVTRDEDDFMFIEVKSSKDKLSEDQKTWIAGNYDELKLPFRVLKIHRVGSSGIAR